MCIHVHIENFLLYAIIPVCTQAWTHMFMDSLATTQGVNGLLSETVQVAPNTGILAQGERRAAESILSPDHSVLAWDRDSQMNLLDEEALASLFPHVSQWLSSDCGWISESKRVLIPVRAEMQLADYSNQLIIEAKSLFWYFFFN